MDLKVLPNPLPGSIAPTVAYTLPRKGNISLKVINLNGQVIYTANPGIQDAGPHDYLLGNLGSSLTAGYYILVLEQDKAIIARTRFIVQ